MLSKILPGLILFAATTSMAFAQCNCSHCAGGAAQGAYQNVTGHCGCGPGQSCADCGTQTGIFGRPAVQDKCACVGKCGCGTPVYGPCGYAWPRRPVPSPLECGTRNDWNHPYFDCCKPCAFDYPYCDPCCRKPYVATYGGYSSSSDIVCEKTFTNVGDVEVDNPGSPPNFTDFRAFLDEEEFQRVQGFRFADGVAGGATIGYRVHPVLRLEAEASYRRNNAENWVINDIVTERRFVFNDPGLTDPTLLTENVTVQTQLLPAVGTLHNYSAMFNAVFDFGIPRIKCCNVYFGGGIGLAYLNGDFAVDYSTANFVPPVPDPSDVRYRIDSTSFAYQFIGGVNVPVTQCIEIFGEYRYLGANNISFENVTTGVPLGRTGGVDTHNVFAGVRLYPKR